MTSPSDDLDLLAVNTIRTLSIDGVQQANSGHPGAPMGAAAMAYALWTRHLRHAPTNPAWPDRDRFVLSAGHASMLLYSLLHLTGYAVSLDDLTLLPPVGLHHPGPPGVRHDAGRGGHHRPARARAWSTASAWPSRSAASPRSSTRPGHDVVDHRTYVICSDGDLQEGITAEASSPRGSPAAGQADRPLRRQPDPARRPHRLDLHRGRARALCRVRLAHPADRGRQRRRGDLAAIEAAKADDRPVDHRGPHPHRLRQPQQAGHAEVARRAAGPGRGPPHQGGLRLGPGQDASSSRRRRASCSAAPSPRARRRGRLGGARRCLCGRLPRRGGRAPPSRRGRPARRLGRRRSPPTRPAPRSPPATPAQDAIQALAAALPELFGGSADLSESNLTDVKALGHDHFAADHAGRNIRFGVREHAMGGIANGIAYHGGFLPYCAHVPDVQRLHARLGADRGPVRAPRDLRLDARLRRPRRGRAHAPAGRALRGAARDPQPVVRPPGRRERGDRGLGAGGGAVITSRMRPPGPWRWRSPARSCRPCPARRSGHARASAAAATSCARRRAARRS